MNQNAVTAEDVKEVIRRYADEHFPGWRSAGVSIRLGEVGTDDEGEYLLVRPIPPASAPLQPAEVQG